MNDLQNRPKNYLVLSILSTVFCCWPLGIPAIVYASQVNTKYAESDYEGAQIASNKAKIWTIWSAVVAIIVWAIYFGFVGFALFAGLSTR